jgi:hypothetical protein
MSPSIHRPPEQCPNDGICLSLGPRVDLHETTLNTVVNDMGSLKKDVHEIKITLRERDNLMGFLKAVFISLLSISFLGLMTVGGQIVMTARWMAQTDMRFTFMERTHADTEQTVADHEARLRSRSQ